MKPSQLIKFRRDRKINQTNMAKEIGISRDTLRKYEMQHESINVPKIVALACGGIVGDLSAFVDEIINKND